MNFLIVDDEKEILEVLEDNLKDAFSDSKIEKVFDGIDAVICITEEKFDLIITDHKMAKMNGVEFLNNLRSMEASKNKETPVIILSGYLPQVRELTQESDKTIFIEKPFNRESLVRNIKILTGNKSA